MLREKCVILTDFNLQFFYVNPYLRKFCVCEKFTWWQHRSHRPEKTFLMLLNYRIIAKWLFSEWSLNTSTFWTVQWTNEIWLYSLNWLIGLTNVMQPVFCIDHILMKICPKHFKSAITYFTISWTIIYWLGPSQYIYITWKHVYCHIYRTMTGIRTRGFWYFWLVTKLDEHKLKSGG